MRGLDRSAVDSPHKGQSRGASMFCLICAWTNGWASNRDAGDLRRHRAYYDVTVMLQFKMNVQSIVNDHVMLQLCRPTGNKSPTYRFTMYLYCEAIATLQCRHNGRDGVSNCQPHDCLFNHLFRRRSKKTSKLRVSGLCAGTSPMTGDFPAQKASNAENLMTSSWTDCLLNWHQLNHCWD